MIVAVALVLLIVMLLSLRVFSASPQDTFVTDGTGKAWTSADWFAGFTLLTGSLFLPAVCEIKYIWWFFLVVTLLIQGKYRILTNFISCTLGLFILWVIFGILVGGLWIRGFLVVIKFVLIMFFFLIGWHVTISQNNIIKIFKYSALGTTISFFVASGVTAWISPSIYYFSTNFIFSLAGLSDYFSVVSPICLGLFFLTGERKYWVLWAGLFVSDVLFAVRTGIGGFVTASVSFFLIRYRRKALPIILLLVVLLPVSILYVPAVREKMFMPEALQRLEVEGPGLYLIDEKNINNNGRSALKQNMLELYPMEDNWLGYGSGTVNQQLRIWAQLLGIAPILHNDYAMILIDHGLVGLWLWCGMLIIIFLNIWFSTGSKRYSPQTQLLGQVAAGSLAGAIFAMGFDNVIAHVMSSIGISFLLIGMFLRSKKQEDAMHNLRDSI